MQKKIFKREHYFICYDCATNNGGVMPPHSVNTMHWDTCPYCNKMESLSATTDYNWSDAKAVWD